jgi:hypothetical protein
MGMYTGLRAKVIVHPRFRGLIASLHSDDESMCWEKSIETNRHSFPDEADSLKEWCKFDRCGFIPFGRLAYMPDDFGDRVEDSDGGSLYDEKTGTWEFACSLKNYESEIQFFVPNVLKVISEEILYCESLYEEYPMPQYYPNPFEDHGPYLSYDEYAHWKQFVRDWTAEP